MAPHAHALVAHEEVADAEDERLGHPVCSVRYGCSTNFEPPTIDEMLAVRLRRTSW